MLLEGDVTRVLIDFGLSSQKECREALHGHCGEPSRIDAVVVSHLHSDHINYSALRVLEEYRVPVAVHQDSLADMRRTHFRGKAFEHLPVITFGIAPFQLGEFEFHPVRVPHQYRMPNFGFVIYSGQGADRKKIVVMTDFYNHRGLSGHFVDAHFIFIEANHDVELLKQFPNENSRYHLSNDKTADLLAEAFRKSSFRPRATMLGHLSEERNSSELVIKTLADALSKNNLAEGVALHVAPARTPSTRIRID